MKTLLCLLLMSSLAYGEGYPIKFTWDIPTLRVDGSNLDISDIKGYIIKEDGIIVSNAIGGNTTSVTIGAREYGSYKCYQIATEAEELGSFSEELCLNIPEKIDDFNVRPNSPLIINFSDIKIASEQ